MLKKNKVLIIGAGMVGRGLIAPMLLDADYMVDFVDVDLSVIGRLKAMKYYPLVGRGVFRWIGPVGAYDSFFSITEELNYQYIFISVKSNNLPKVAKLVEKIIQLSITNPIIYVIENYPNAAEKFGKMLKVDGAIVADGIANVIVPLSPHQKDDPTFTVYDPSMELLLEEVITAPKIKTARYVNREDFEFEWDLKLHLHCALHFFVGAVGLQNDIEYVHQVVVDERTEPQISVFAWKIAEALGKKYPSRVQEIDTRFIKELSDMKCELFMDDCIRVTRDIERKIDPDERIFGTAALLYEYNGSCDIMNIIRDQLYEFTQDNIISLWNNSDIEYGAIEVLVMNQLVKAGKNE